jgi:hypothetical protein
LFEEKMEMTSIVVKRVLPKAVAWAFLIAFSAAIALAQDAAAPAPAGQRTDGQIEMDVVHVLDASAALKNDLITAATVQGEVTLSGTVANDASRELAEAIAGNVTGVTKVHNNLKIGNPQDSQDAQNAANPNAQQMADDAAPGQEAAPPPSINDGPQAAMPNPPAEAAPGSMPGSMSGSMQSPMQPPPPPPQRAQYAPAAAPMPAYEPPKGPVTIPQGTLLQMRTNEPVNSKNAKDGTQVQFTMIHDVVFGGVLAIPRGATVHGVVTESKKAGQLGGSPELALTLTSLDLGGQNYPLQSDQFKVKGPNKAGQTVNNALGGAMLGAIIGGIAGHGAGAAIGAGAGAAAGTAASAASSGPNAWIPAEALVDFHLNQPLTVTPVNAQEAARLAQGLYPGGPNLYRRGPYGRPYYVGYPYGYPPVYYRPYVMMGGYYSWR